MMLFQVSIHLDLQRRHLPVIFQGILPRPILHLEPAHLRQERFDRFFRQFRLASE